MLSLFLGRMPIVVLVPTAHGCHNSMRHISHNEQIKISKDFIIMRYIASELRYCLVFMPACLPASLAISSMLPSREYYCKINLFLPEFLSLNSAFRSKENPTVTDCFKKHSLLLHSQIESTTVLTFHLITRTEETLAYKKKQLENVFF